MDKKNNTNPAFQLRKYSFKRKFFKLFGARLTVFDSEGNNLMFSPKRMLEPQKEFVIYENKNKDKIILKIKTSDIIDNNQMFIITDGSENTIGMIQKRISGSVFKDEWMIFTDKNEKIGIIKELSAARALFSKLMHIIPQKYTVETEGRPKNLVAKIHQHFNILVLKLTLNIIQPFPSLDTRLLVAAGIILCAVERRQTGFQVV
ncbi:MAG: hypothetical protein ACOC5R_02510 [Elusimicrobiota bacterium]